MLVLGFALLFATGASAAAEAKSPKQRVRQFVAAFNAQDADAMAAMVDADVEWLMIDGSTVSVETRGREALRTAMRKYFASCPSCRSKLGRLVASRQRVSSVETASWQGRDGPRAQRSLSVYEFADGLIRRVYYFPVEP